jgi:dihydroneopterin aldolase
VDKIFLRELKIETIIGFWEWERRIKQVASLDLEIGTDARIAAGSDGIAGTLNYEQLAKRLVEFVGADRLRLVRSSTKRRSPKIFIANSIGTPSFSLRLGAFIIPRM